MTTQTKTTWRKVRAEEICARVTDGTHDTPKRLTEGFSLITSKQLTDGAIAATDYFISEKDFEEVNKRSKVDRWDVLFGMIGTIGEVAIVKDRNPKFAIKNIGLFKVGGDKILSRWLYYYFESPAGKAYIKSVTRGTSQGYVPLESLRDFPVLIPEDNEDREKLVSILSVFDDKIELNNKASRTLEQMAQVIFKEWFVNSENLKVKRGKLGDLVDISYGRGPSSNQLKKTGYPVYGANGIIGYFDSYDFLDRQIIIGCRGVVGNVTLTLPQCIITHNSLVITPNDKRKTFFYYLLRNQNLDAVVGGSAQPQITINDLEGLELLLPEEKSQDKFESIAENIEQKRLTIFYENQKLAALRDLLLRKLMSGEIRV